MLTTTLRKIMRARPCDEWRWIIRGKARDLGVPNIDYPIPLAEVFGEIPNFSDYFYALIWATRFIESGEVVLDFSIVLLERVFGEKRKALYLRECLRKRRRPKATRRYKAVNPPYYSVAKQVSNWLDGRRPNCERIMELALWNWKTDICRELLYEVVSEGENERLALFIATPDGETLDWSRIVRTGADGGPSLDMIRLERLAWREWESLQGKSAVALSRMDEQGRLIESWSGTLSVSHDNWRLDWEQPGGGRAAHKCTGTCGV